MKQANKEGSESPTKHVGTSLSKGSMDKRSNICPSVRVKSSLKDLLNYHLYTSDKLTSILKPINQVIPKVRQALPNVSAIVC